MAKPGAGKKQVAQYRAKCDRETNRRLKKDAKMFNGCAKAGLGCLFSPIIVLFGGGKKKRRRKKR